MHYENKNMEIINTKHFTYLGAWDSYNKMSKDILDKEQRIRCTTLRDTIKRKH